MPCSECGASIERTALDAHRCDEERRLDFAMFTMRDDIAAIERQVREHLATPTGRFESWLAARDVRRAAG
jgi:hypothetical protein